MKNSRYEMTFEEFKKKNEEYYKSKMEKNKKLLKTETLFHKGKPLTLEDAMKLGYQDECYYEENLKDKAR